MQCVKNCTTGALSKIETEKVRVAGHDLEWVKLDPYACEASIKGRYDNERNPFIGEYPRQFGYGRAIEGAAGCIRVCMVHLEQRDKLKNKFNEPFRTNRMWSVDHKNEDVVAPAVEEEYIKKGKVENYKDYITYNKTSNYGTEKILLVIRALDLERMTNNTKVIFVWEALLMQKKDTSQIKYEVGYQLSNGDFSCTGTLWTVTDYPLILEN